MLQQKFSRIIWTQSVLFPCWDLWEIPINSANVIKSLIESVRWEKERYMGCSLSRLDKLFPSKAWAIMSSEIPGQDGSCKGLDAKTAEHGILKINLQQFYAVRISIWNLSFHAYAPRFHRASSSSFDHAPAFFLSLNNLFVADWVRIIRMSRSFGWFSDKNGRMTCTYCDIPV